jgi:hypothetical protein
MIYAKQAKYHPAKYQGDNLMRPSQPAALFAASIVSVRPWHLPPARHMPPTLSDQADPLDRAVCGRRRLGLPGAHDRTGAVGKVGQPVVVDNKPGGNTAIGASETARSPADGYTVLSADNGTLVFNPVLYKTLSYNPTRDLAPVTLIGRFPMILVVGPGSRPRPRRNSSHRSRPRPAASTMAPPARAARTIWRWNCSRWKRT